MDIAITVTCLKGVNGFDSVKLRYFERVNQMKQHEVKEV